MKCLKENGMKDCAGLMANLNICLDKTKMELAPKYGLTDIKWYVNDLLLNKLIVNTTFRKF